VTTRALLAWALGSGVPMLGLGPVAVVALATDEVGVDEIALTALALGAVVLSVGLLVTLQAARAIAEPVISVRRALRRVEEGDFSAGRVVAGNIGAESRFEYTVIGDPVNEAARLCELAKGKEKRVLASAAALERVEDGERERWRMGDPVELRGRREPTRPAAPV